MLIKEKITEKKKILIAAGYKIYKNEFYIGYYRKGISTSLYKDQCTIIKNILKFTDKYEVIFKDYPYGDKNMKYFIKDISGDKIKYIYNENNLTDLLKESDFNIFLYLSTSFMESLNFNSDTAILETELSKEFKKKELEKFGINVCENIKNLNNIIDFKLKNNSFLNVEKQYLRNKFFFDSKKIKNITSISKIL